MGTTPARGWRMSIAPKPLAVDLYCGLGGWSAALLAEGYQVVGFDVERHEYGKDRYPAQLVLQDVLTLNGAQFRDAALIVASPPCTEYSYMAMPWTRAKQIARALRGEDEFPEGYSGSRTVPQLTALFDACFRIQREASEAAGRHIPLVVENVKGAQPWVGRAAWNFGSFYLWGDVPALMPVPIDARKLGGGASWYPPDDPRHQPGLDFTRLAGQKNPGFRFDGSGKSFQSESVNRHVSGGVKVASESGRRTDPGKGARFTSRDCGMEVSGVKHGGEWFHDPSSPSRQGGVTYAEPAVDAGRGTKGFAVRLGQSVHARTGSKSSARKAASARIAKIPPALAEHIARCYLPEAVA